MSGSFAAATSIVFSIAWAVCTVPPVHAAGPECHEPAVQRRQTIVLAGDSTVTDDAGWGQGFKEQMRFPEDCLNLAKSGRSSRSFRTEGWWKKCLEAKPDYLLIQFGHNDQPGKGPERESAADGAFRDHLRQFIDDAVAAGIRPILVTSLTRRRWNQDGTIEPTLADYATATQVVAREKQVPLLDLHRLSIQQAEAAGPEAFRAFEPMTVTGADHTHLNPEGSRMVGRLVAREFVRLVPELTDCFMIEPEQGTAAPEKSQSGLVSGSLRLREEENTITIFQGENLVLTYNKVSPPVPSGMSPLYNRSGFLHPLASPLGKVVTATFPADHPHQHGLFSAWVKTTWNEREIDFWNLAGGTGRVVHQRVISTFTEGDRLGFEVDLVHRAEQSPVVDILRERWKIVAFPTDDSYHGFDIETTQQALTDKPLTVQKYHYGGMAMRGPVRWLSETDRDPDGGDTVREPSAILNDRGSDRIAGNHEHAKWVSLTGNVEGKPVTITMMCHAENFRAPQAARLHPTKPYFVFAPCVDGEFVIDREHPFNARYRCLITDAAPDQKWLDEQWRIWCPSSP